jgi:hypothetical protein
MPPKQPCPGSRAADCLRKDRVPVSRRKQGGDERHSWWSAPVRPQEGNGTHVEQVSPSCDSTTSATNLSCTLHTGAKTPTSANTGRRTINAPGPNPARNDAPGDVDPNGSTARYRATPPTRTGRRSHRVAGSPDRAPPSAATATANDVLPIRTATGAHQLHPFPATTAEPNTAKPTRPATAPMTRRKIGQRLTHPRPRRTRPHPSSILPKTPIKSHSICRDATYGFPSSIPLSIPAGVSEFEVRTADGAART